MLKVAPPGGPPARRPRALAVPDLYQVPQPSRGPVTGRLVPVVAVHDRHRADVHHELPAVTQPQPPAAVPTGWPVVPFQGQCGVPGLTGRRRRRPLGRAGANRPRAAMAHGLTTLIGHGHAPGAARISRRIPDQPARHVRIDRAEPGRFARTPRPARGGTERNGQVDAGPCPVRLGARRELSLAGLSIVGAGVDPEGQVEERPGPELIHGAIETGRPSVPGRSGDALVGGERLAAADPARIARPCLRLPPQSTRASFSACSRRRRAAAGSTVSTAGPARPGAVPGSSVLDTGQHERFDRGGAHRHRGSGWPRR